jgi:hypothetical protein
VVFSGVILMMVGGWTCFHSIAGARAVVDSLGGYSVGSALD